MFLCGIVGCSRSPDSSPTRTDDSIEARVDAYLKPYVDARDFAGVVLIGRGDRVILEKAYGLANIESNEPHTVHTVFPIASLTKTFTAASILILEQQGKLALEDPLSTYWSGYPRGDDISIEQLLLHQAGIASEAAYPDYPTRSKHSLSLEELASWIATQPLAYEPGEDSAYSKFWLQPFGLRCRTSGGSALCQPSPRQNISAD